MGWREKASTELCEGANHRRVVQFEPYALRTMGYRLTGSRTSLTREWHHLSFRRFRHFARYYHCNHCQCSFRGVHSEIAAAFSQPRKQVLNSGSKRAENWSRSINRLWRIDYLSSRPWRRKHFNQFGNFDETCDHVARQTHASKEGNRLWKTFSTQWIERVILLLNLKDVACKKFYR